MLTVKHTESLFLVLICFLYRKYTAIICELTNGWFSIAFHFYEMCSFYPQNLSLWFSACIIYVSLSPRMGSSFSMELEQFRWYLQRFIISFVVSLELISVI